MLRSGSTFFEVRRQSGHLSHSSFKRPRHQRQLRRRRLKLQPLIFEIGLPSEARTGPTSGDVVVASLPARPLDLSIYLPIGSEEGRYEVAILRAEGNPLVAVGGSATLQNRKVTLQLRTDLTGFAPGRYLLGVRKGNFRWAYYPIALAK